MRATKVITCIIFFAPLISIAETDPECIKHLGGAFAGVECYNGLSNDITAENKILIEKINSIIPKNNKNKTLLKKYVHYQIESKNYCALSRDSYTGWVSEKRVANPRYHDYDVIYHECIYEILINQNKFLKKILNNSSQ